MPAIDYRIELAANTSALTAVHAALTTTTHAADALGSAFVGSMNHSVAATHQLTAALGAVKAQAAGSGAGGGGILGDIIGGNIATQLLATAGREVLAFGGNALSMAGDVEQAQVAFTGLLGSGQAATAFLQELRVFADKTPFEFPELRQDAVQMLGVGIAAQDILPDLTAVGNMIAGTGGSKQQLQEVALAYEQINSKGKLQGQEALQLQNANVNVWHILADQLGITSAKAEQLSADGKITAAVFDQAFNAYAAEHFGNAMAAQSLTLKGLGSTASDLLGTLTSGFGTAVVTASGLEPKMAGLIAQLSNPAVIKWITDLGTGIGTVANTLLTAAGAAASFVGTLLGLPATALAPVAAGLDTAATSAGGLTLALTASESAADRTKRIVGDLQDSMAGLRDRAATVAAGYDSEIAPLRTKLTLMERANAAASKEIELKRLDKDIAADTGLAQDKFSSLGIAAARRLEGEVDQRAALVREQGQIRAKNGVQDQIAGIERQKATAAAAYAAQERSLERQIRLIQETNKAQAALPPVIDANSKAYLKAADDYYNMTHPGSNPPLISGPGGIKGIQSAIDGLLSSGALGLLGLGIKGVYDNWGLVAGAFQTAPTILDPLRTQLDLLYNALGGKNGLEGAVTGLGFAWERLIRSLGADNKTFEWIGHELAVTGLQATQLTAGLRAGVDAVKIFGGDTSQATRSDLDKALVDGQVAGERIDREQGRWKARDTQLNTQHSAAISTINADIDTREAAAMAALTARQQGTGAAAPQPGTIGADGRVIQGPTRPLQGPVRPGQILPQNPQSGTLTVVNNVVVDGKIIATTVNRELGNPRNRAMIMGQVAAGLQAGS